MKIIKVVFGFILTMLIGFLLHWTRLCIGLFFSKIKHDYAEYYDPSEDKHKVDAFSDLYKFVSYENVVNHMKDESTEGWKWVFGIK